MLALMLALTACTPTGDWTLNAWGEEYIEVEIPAADFSDGCSAVYDGFEATIGSGSLLDGNGDAVVQMDHSHPIELTIAGPRPVHSFMDVVPVGTYDNALYVVESTAVSGLLSCPGGTVTFDWAFATPTTYDCELEALEVIAGQEAVTEATIHGDHLFYDHLEDPEAVLIGEHIVAADADSDGVVTHAELAAVDIAPLGVGVGRFSEVTDLDAFVGVLSQTLGHIDGEGHCDTDL